MMPKSATECRRKRSPPKKEDPYCPENHPTATKATKSLKSVTSISRLRSATSQISKHTFGSKKQIPSEEFNIKLNRPGLIEMQRDETLHLCNPKEDPPFFNIFIEKRHAENLQKPSLDDESRLEVIYQVLKD